MGAQLTLGAVRVARAQRLHRTTAQQRHEGELNGQVILRLLEPRVLREPGAAIHVEHLAVGVLHHETALARVHRLVGEGLLRRARPHAEESAVEHDGQLLELALVARGEVSLKGGEPVGQGGIVGRQRGTLRKRPGERRVNLSLVATRQQRVHAAAILAEVDEVLNELRRHGIGHD